MIWTRFEAGGQIPEAKRVSLVAASLTLLGIHPRRGGPMGIRSLWGSFPTVPQILERLLSFQR